MKEQNRFKLEISEETRYEDEEISKSQAEINEELYGFMAEFKEEVAQFRAQHNEEMADIRSKLNRIMDLLQDMKKSEGLEPLDLIGAPLDQVTSNPDGPTLKYSASAIVLGNPVDEMLGINKALDLDEDCVDESAYDAELGLDTTVAGNPVDDKMLKDTKLIDSEEFKGNDSAIKIVEAGNHFTKLLLPKSVGTDEGIGQNEGNHGNEIDGEFAQVIKTSFSDALLTHIYFQNNQTWIITKYGLISSNLHSSRENLTYLAFVEFKNASFSTDVDVRFYFDPGGIYVTCFSRGALHPLISKAPGICVNGMKKIVPPLRHALSVMASGDKNCLVGSNYSYLFSNGVHTILVVRVDSGTHEDDFTKVDSKAMFEGVNFKLTMECILAYLAHSELVLSYPIEGLFIKDKVICILTAYITGSLKNEYFDMFSRASKEMVPLLRMLFSTHWVKFAQLPSWSSESSKLMAWSSVLSFIHNSIKIRLKQIGYYVNDCLVSNWHNLLHSTESFCDAKSLMHDTVAIPYSMHLWGLVLRSFYVVLDGHGVSNAYEKNNVASMYPDDAILQKGSISDEVPFKGKKCPHLRTALQVDQALENQFNVDAFCEATTLMMGKYHLAAQFDISIQLKESMHVGRGYSIYKEAVAASSKEKAEVDTMTFMKLALDQAKVALDSLEMPVGCVIMEDGKVIASGRNRTAETRKATRHAGMEAIDVLLDQWQIDGLLPGEAAGKFSNCRLYVKCEPCIMCASALSMISVNEVYYECPNDKFRGYGSILWLHADKREDPSFPGKHSQEGFKCKVSLNETGFLHVVSFCTKQSIHWHMLLHTLVLRYIIPPSFKLIKFGLPPHDNIVQLKEVCWKLAVTLVKEFMFRGFVVAFPEDVVSMLDIHNSETFGHIVRKIADGAYKIADELKTLLTNEISTYIEVMDQGQHMSGVNNFTECLPMGCWLYVCDVFLDTISMILVYALVPFVHGLVIKASQQVLLLRRILYGIPAFVISSP